MTLISKVLDRVKRAAMYPQEALRVLREAQEVLNALYREGRDYIRPGIAVKEPRSELIAVGDIHGEMLTLRNLLSREEAYFEGPLKSGDGMVVFLGDYVDRGDLQLEALLLPLTLMIECPETVIVLRGNHEPPRGLEPYPHDFPYHLIERYGREDGIRIYEEARKVFDLMPYAAIVLRELLLVHGGPPSTVASENVSTLLEALGAGSSEPPRRVLEEVLWNDPAEGLEYTMPSPRGAGVLWGAKITEAALLKGEIKAIVRGHEPCIEGYRLNHNGRVLTLFTRVGPPYMNTTAAYLHLKFKENWHEEFENMVVKLKPLPL